MSRAFDAVAIIKSEVADAFGVPELELESKGRERRYTTPRFVAIYLARDLTRHSFPVLGRCFGGRDHTTIMNAIDRLEQMMAEDARLAETVEMLRVKLTPAVAGVEHDDQLFVIADLCLTKIERETIKQTRDLMTRLRRRAETDPGAVLQELYRMERRLDGPGGDVLPLFASRPQAAGDGR